MAEGDCKSLFTATKHVKVIFVGKEATGKTSLIKRITNRWTIMDSVLGATIGQGRRNATDGIETRVWNSPAPALANTTFHLWDFAGQKLYYNTHQFFLSNNSINLLLFDSTKSLKDNKLGFWMSSIQAKAPNSIVYLVGTFVDKLSQHKRLQSLKQVSHMVEQLWNRVVSKDSLR